MPTNPNASPSSSALDAIRGDLQRHQVRREHGVPTVTVIVGRRGSAIRAWTSWRATPVLGSLVIEGDSPNDLTLGVVRWYESRSTCRLPRPIRHGPLHALAPDVWNPQSPEPGPALLVMAASKGAGVPTLVTLGPDLALLASVACAVPVGLVVPDLPDQPTLPESHWWALLREGIIRLPEDPTSLGPRPPSLSAAEIPVSPRTKDQLRHDEVGPVVMEALDATLRASQPPRDELLFRSRAERLLFEWLEEHPRTSGLFQPNVRLDVPASKSFMEVDLLSRSLSLAIEVDGVFHFRTDDDYRTDRAKDQALQVQGFLVLRFLADDVMSRLDDVACVILTTLTHRCNHPGGTNS